MADVRAYLGQALLYGLFFVPIAWLTQQPDHSHLPADTAVFKVSVRHAGKVIGECVPVQGPEYDRLPANMQRPEVCPRERSPLELQVILDGQSLLHATVPASGVHSDGVSSLYRRFNVPAGAHRLELLLKDDAAAEDYGWRLSQVIELRPAQVMVATFKEGFVIQ